MAKLLKKGGFIAIIIGIVAIGAFLRSYHFSDWLHFELDQGRDARVIDGAIEDGIGQLPLQGPRAGGTFLRLGPAFYYLEYASALIFGNTPPGIAMVVLILSVAALPLFYFFCRRYFDKKISAGLLFLFSVSLFLVLYSRFAWNPNLIPFFALLTFYGLLRAADHDEKRKALWLYAAAAGLAIGTQLHFLAFLSLPVITAVFLLLKRPRLKLQQWGIAVFIIIAAYAPVIINDIKTGGANLGEFKEAITGKSEDNDHTSLEKTIRSGTEHARGFFIVISGQEQTELPKVDLNTEQGLVDVKCDHDCRKNIIFGAMAALVLLSGILLLGWNLIKEKDKINRDFLIMVTLWLAVSIAVLMPIAYDISPRFFLISAPLALVLLGFVAAFIDRKIGDSKKWVALVIIAVFAIPNLLGVKNRFSELRSAPYEDVKIKADRILKERARVTYEQEKIIVDYIEDISRKNNYPIYIFSDGQYKRAIDFLVERRGFNSEFIHLNVIYQNGNHFLIFRSSSDLADRTEKYREKFEFLEQKQFGTLTVFYLKPKPEAVAAVEQIFEDETGSTSAAPKRYTWEEIFSDFEQDEE